MTIAQLNEIKHNEVEALHAEIDILRESITDLVLQIDNAGWSPLHNLDTEENGGLTLDQVKKLAKSYREFVAANPLVNRAINIRTSYTWGEGVTFNSNQHQKLKQILNLSKTAFGTVSAHRKIESALTYTGNVFFLTDLRSRETVTIPITNISHYYPDINDNTKLSYLEVTYVTRTRHVVTGEITKGTKKVVYPLANADGSHLNDTFKVITDGSNKTVVDRTKVITHIKANDQDGWLFGVPDMLSSNFWVRAYTRAQEANLSLTESLARFAWKVVNPNNKGNVKNASVKVANAQGVGNAAVMDGGNDLQAVNKAGANVDFDNPWPIAAMVAAGFGIPLDDLLYQRGAVNSDGSMPDVLVSTISTRQARWAECLADVLELAGVTAEVILPRLFSEPVHRVMQAIGVAAGTGTLHPEEVRAAVILQMRRYGVKEFKKAPPKPGEWAEYAKGGTDNPGTTPLVTPDDTGTADGRAPGGALADGDNEMAQSE